MLPVAVKGSGFTGYCKVHKTQVAGFLLSSQNFVRINGMPISVVGTKGKGFCGHTTQIIQGSSFFKINGIPVARLTSSTGADIINPGQVIQGVPFVRVSS